MAGISRDIRHRNIANGEEDVELVMGGSVEIILGDRYVKGGRDIRHGDIWDPVVEIVLGGGYLKGGRDVRHQDSSNSITVVTSQ